ncbi:MAG: CocE/NonD family hydrolase [Solirubrobacteraceae bacterium]
MTLLSQILARRMRLIAPATLDVACERDLPAVMDDGAVLLADRWCARDGGPPRPRPTVLVRSPYGRRQLVGLLLGRLPAERGLQVVVQSVRGTFGSGGEFTPFRERDDGLATLRWLRSQQWHAGPVGTIGPSYLGFVQWAVAGEGGDLAAMSIHVSASEFYGQTYAGGSVSLENVVSWMAILAVQERRLAPVAINRALRGLPSVMSELPLDGLDERATGAPVPWFRDAFTSRRRDDPYWASRDHSAAVPGVTAPVQFVGGWYDILLPWMLADFEALQAAGRAPQLLIGPWTHIAPGLTAAAERDGIAWLRAHLLGDDRLVRRTPVRLLVTGERAGGGWRDLPAWPPPGVGERRLFLAGGGLAGGGRLEDRPPRDDDDAGTAPDRYRYDPADPTPALGGPVLLARRAVLDNAPLEARPDVLTYTTAPLPATLEAIGHVRVQLWARASRPHFDLFARVCDVGADGVSRNVCDALSTVSPSDGVEPGCDGAWQVAFELWPIGHRFAAGNRVRLQVSSGAHPRYARNPGTGEGPATATIMVAVEIELLHDAEHPSALVLPAMPS